MSSDPGPEERRLLFVKAREHSDLTQEEAAKRLGKSVASISRKERGEQPVTAADIIAMQAIAEDEQSQRLGKVTRGTSLEEATYLPADLREVARQFEIELARIGAANDEIDHVNKTLRSEHVATLVTGWESAEERQAEFRLQLRALLRWTLMRMEFFGRKPQRALTDIEDLIAPTRKAPPGMFKPAPRRRSKEEEG